MQGITYIKTPNQSRNKYLVKTRFYKLFLLISIYFYLYPPVSIYSQTDSLYHYLEIAAENNPSVQQKFMEYQAALQKIPQAGSLSYPELSLGAFLKPMELVNGNQVADIRLMQMFPWFGTLKAAKDEMSHMANAKFELFRDTKLQVFYDVQRTWYELFKIQKEISISEKNIEILKTIERLAIVRFQTNSSSGYGTSNGNSGMNTGTTQNLNNGAASMQSMGRSQSVSMNSVTKQTSQTMKTVSMEASSDNSGLAALYRIQIETGELQNNIALLKNQKNTLIAQFNSYLNRTASTPVFIPETVSPDSLGLSFISVSDSILAKNPMLSMLEYEKRSFEVRKKMVKNMGYPMVGLGLDYSLISKNEMSASAMNGKDMIMPMVVITLPIYRKKYAAMVNEAELLKAAASQDYTSTANSLQTEHYNAIQLYEDAQRRIKLYENQFLLASKSFDLMLKGFSSSSSGLTDILRVRQQILDYELKQVEAVADFNTAVARLKRLGNLVINGNN